MACMITKLYTMHMFVNVQISLKLPVVFAEIRPPKTEKNKFKIVHVFGSVFGFSAYMKVLIGFKAFYFFGLVSVYM